jgi:mRNA interferase RelE/StbE
MLELEGDPRPRGCRKLFDNIYRIRIGDYRVVYKIDDERRAVAVGKIARRRENTCRDVEGLF